MGVNRGTVWFVLFAGGFFGLWTLGQRASEEIAVLHTIDGESEDRYSSLWVVDDAGWTWIRAYRPDVRWLDNLLAHPYVELERAGETLRYRAAILPREVSGERVDALMAEKYGPAEWLRARLSDDDTVPIRLEMLEPGPRHVVLDD